MEVADLQDLRSEGAAYSYSFGAQALGHNHEHLVAFDGGDHREGVAGVAGCGLDDGVAFGEQTLPLGLLHHVPGDSRLDRARGVEVLELAVDALDLEHRRVPYGVEDAARESALARSGLQHGLDLLFRRYICPGEATVNQ